MEITKFELKLIDDAYQEVAIVLYEDNWREQCEKKNSNEKLSEIAQFLNDIVLDSLIKGVDYFNDFNCYFTIYDGELYKMCGGRATKDPYLLKCDLQWFISNLKENYLWDTKYSKALFYIENMLSFFDKVNKNRVKEYYKDDYNI